MTPTLKEKYQQQIAAKMCEAKSYKNKMQAPKIEKIVVNMGLSTNVDKDDYKRATEELAQITNQAILDLGGRLDAYQRMFEDDVDPDLIKRRVESAEIMNRQTGDRYEEQANMRNTELLMMLILMESQVR